MSGRRRKTGSADKARLRPYYEVRPDDLEAREALNQLVGFDVGETERRGWAWVERHAPTASTGFGHADASSTTDPTAGEQTEVTKVRALRGELTNALANLKFMYGPERTAGRRWNAALDALVYAVEAFLPFAEVREHETSVFASRVSPGGRDHYDEISAGTAKIRAIAKNLATRARAAQKKIGVYRDDPLPGLEQTKPHRDFLARLCARLSLARFTMLEIGDLIPDRNRIEDEREESQIRARALADGTAPALAQEALAAYRERYRREHAERISYLVRGVKPKIVQERAAALRSDAALGAFMARTGHETGNIDEWFDQFLASPEGLASESSNRG